MSWFAGWFGEQIKYVEASMDAFLVGSTATLASVLPSNGIVPMIGAQNCLAVEVTVEGELSIEVVTA